MFFLIICLFLHVNLWCCEESFIPCADDCVRFTIREYKPRNVFIARKNTEGREKKLHLTVNEKGGVLFCNFAEEEKALRTILQSRPEAVKYMALSPISCAEGSKAGFLTPALGVSRDACGQIFLKTFQMANTLHPNARMVSFLRGGLAIKSAAEEYQYNIKMALLTTRHIMQQGKSVKGLDHIPWGDGNVTVIIDDIFDTGRTVAEAYYAIKEIVGFDTVVKLPCFFGFLKGSHRHTRGDVTYGFGPDDMALVEDPFERFVTRVTEEEFLRNEWPLNNEVIKSETFLEKKRVWTARMEKDIVDLKFFCNAGQDWLVLPCEGGGLLEQFKLDTSALPDKGCVILGPVPAGLPFSGSDFYHAQASLSNMLEESGKKWGYWYEEEVDGKKVPLVRDVQGYQSYAAVGLPSGLSQEDIALSKKVLNAWMQNELSIKMPACKTFIIVDQYGDFCTPQAIVHAPFPIAMTVKKAKISLIES